jgi:hypothetical protein
VSFIQNDLLSDSGLQEGADCIRVSAIDGGGLSIWAPDFRERVPWSRSTFWWSLARFEHLLQPGRIIDPFQPAGRTSSPGGLSVHLLLASLGSSLYPAFGGIFCISGSIL